MMIRDAKQEKLQLDACQKEGVKEPGMKESRGEKLYNGVVYTGINYLLNLGISIATADYFINLGGKKHLEKGISRFANGISSLKLFSHGSAKTISAGVLKTLALTSGGMALLVPTKIMEDHKRPIVHWLNKNVYGDKQLAEDGHEKTPDEIYIEKEQPKQSWWNVIKRRAYVAGIILSSGAVLESTIGSEKATNAIAGQANKVFRSGYVPGGEWIASNARAQRYLKFAALDTMFVGINAVVMYLTNGAKKAAENAKPVAAPQPAEDMDCKAVVAASMSEMQRKKKTVVPMENYAELVRSGETDYAVLR
jgi:hypothetical protein